MMENTKKKYSAEYVLDMANLCNKVLMADTYEEAKKIVAAKLMDLLVSETNHEEIKTNAVNKAPHSKPPIPAPKREENADTDEAPARNTEKSDHVAECEPAPNNESEEEEMPSYMAAFLDEQLDGQQSLFEEPAETKEEEPEKAKKRTKKATKEATECTEDASDHAAEKTTLTREEALAVVFHMTESTPSQFEEFDGMTMGEMIAENRNIPRYLLRDAVVRGISPDVVMAAKVLVA